jgi:ComEC/Rec2-related protein
VRKRDGWRGRGIERVPVNAGVGPPRAVGPQDGDNEEVSLWAAPEVPASLVVFFGLAGAGRLAFATVVAGIGLMTGVVVVRGLERHLSGKIVRVESGRTTTLRGWRVPAGVAIGLLVLAGGLARAHAPQRSFRSPFDPLTIGKVEGRLLHDLRPGTSSFRRVEIETLRVFTRQGWSGAAEGRLVVLWQGTEYLHAGINRAIPVRGDMVTVNVGDGIEVARRSPDGGEEVPVRSPTVIWTDETRLVLHPAQGLPGIRRIAREWLRKRLARLDPLGGPMVLALLLGDRGALSPEIADDVRRSGSSHVLALSGMHLGVLALILYQGPLRFLSPRARTTAILPLLLLYVWVAGWIPSLVRALVLVLVSAVPRIRSASVPMPLLLARTVVVVGMLSPETAGNLGFQLSVLALVGIVVLSPGVVDRLTPIVGRGLGAYVGITVAAMVATAPLSLGVFGSVYPGGILMAGVLSALIVLQMWLGVAFLALATVPVAGTLVAWVIRWNTRLVASSASLGSRIPPLLTGNIGQGDVFGIVSAGIVIVLLFGTVLWLVLRIHGRYVFGLYPDGGEGEPQLDF